MGQGIQTGDILQKVTERTEGGINARARAPVFAPTVQTKVAQWQRPGFCPINKNSAL